VSRIRERRTIRGAPESNHGVLIRLFTGCGAAGALVILVASAATAQQPSPRQPWPISAGDRVRIYSPAGDTVRAEGTVERVVDGRVVLARSGGGESYSVPLEPNDLFAVRRTVPPGQSARRRAIWGLFLGASIGGIAGPFVDGAADARVSTGASVGIGVGAGGLVGAAVGAAVGYLFPGHTWERFRVGPG
jgi:hypothetical protein